LLRLAMANGVEALAYRADISMDQIYLTRQLPVIV
jgi:DNA-binding sugar fermentation-stimulating protein